MTQSEKSKFLDRVQYFIENYLSNCDDKGLVDNFNLIVEMIVQYTKEDHFFPHKICPIHKDNKLNQIYIFYPQKDTAYEA